MVTLSVSVVVKSFDGLEEPSCAKTAGEKDSNRSEKSVYNPADFKIMSLFLLRLEFNLRVWPNTDYSNTVSNCTAFEFCSEFPNESRTEFFAHWWKSVKAEQTGK